MLSEQETLDPGENAAWEQFAKTGKVQDYIAYLSCKNKDIAEQETSADADQNPGLGAQTTEYR